MKHIVTILLFKEGWESPVIVITCLEIIETLDLPVSIDTVWRFLQEAGYRRKKKSLHASEQERPRCGAEEKRLERPYIWIQGK